MTWLCFYEWMLTANAEFELIHRARWTSVKITYLLCRYYPLMYLPFLSWGYVGDHDPRLCPRVVVPLQFLQAPLQIFPQAVMVMRAYGFTGRDRKALIGLSLGYLILVTVNLGVFITENTLPEEFFYQEMGPTGCFPNYGTTVMAVHLGYIMLVAFLMDAISLGVILWHFYRTRGADISLGRFFVLQGIYAFCFALAINLMTAVLFFDPNNKYTGIGLPLFLVTPNLIACRLVLQLRRKVTLTDSEISRRNSEIVHNALATRSCGPSDPWLLGEEPPEPEPETPLSPYP